jgi:hypothetical protein
MTGQILTGRLHLEPSCGLHWCTLSQHDWNAQTERCRLRAPTWTLIAALYMLSAHQLARVASPFGLHLHAITSNTSGGQTAPRPNPEGSLNRLAFGAPPRLAKANTLDT